MDSNTIKSILEIGETIAVESAAEMVLRMTFTKRYAPF